MQACARTSPIIAVSITKKWHGVMRELVYYLDRRDLLPSEKRVIRISCGHFAHTDATVERARALAKSQGVCFSPWILQAAYEKLMRDRSRDCSDRFLSRSAWIIQAIKEKLDANQDN